MSTPAFLTPERLAELAVADSGFVFDPRSGQSFTLNATGAAALACLRAGLDVAATAEALAQRCNQPADFILPAIAAFARQLDRVLP
ncbi:MAG: PqqD family protein [Alphaproteobacteria bacterium]|nr:PqqD family protein [Alphaproteobacteria bacterium]TAD87326.1 MAG: PqqD family protein [Alphaproteobacteria bacterium]